MKSYFISFILKITGVIASFALSSVLLTFFEIEIASEFFILISITTVIAGFLNLGATQRLISEIPVIINRNYTQLFLIEIFKITLLVILLYCLVLVLNYIFIFNFKFLKLLLIGYLIAISKVLYTILRGMGKGNHAEFVDLVIKNLLYILFLIFVYFYFKSSIYFVLITTQIIVIIIYLITLFKHSHFSLYFEKKMINLKIFSFFDNYAIYNFLNISRSHLPMLIAGFILSAEDIVLYKLGIQISNLVIFGAMAVNITQSPNVSRLLNNSNYVDLQNVYNKGFYFSLRLSVITIITIFLFFDYFNELFFHIDNFNLPIVIFLIPQFIYVLSGPSIQYLCLLGKVKRTNYYQLYGLISIIFFSGLFSPFIGVLSLIIADIIANIVSHVAATAYLLKTTKLKYPFRCHTN